MELKDVILSTLAEMEDNEVTKMALNTVNVNTVNNKSNTPPFDIKDAIKPNLNNINTIIKKEIYPTEVIQEVHEEFQFHYESKVPAQEGELIYLNSIRERLLVLFEGFQAPNNTNIEAKVDMTLNFLEYILATIDNRVETLKKGKSNESI